MTAKNVDKGMSTLEFLGQTYATDEIITYPLYDNPHNRKCLNSTTFNINHAISLTRCDFGGPTANIAMPCEQISFSVFIKFSL